MHTKEVKSKYEYLLDADLDTSSENMQFFSFSDSLIAHILDNDIAYYLWQLKNGEISPSKVDLTEEIQSYKLPYGSNNSVRNSKNQDNANASKVENLHELFSSGIFNQAEFTLIDEYFKNVMINNDINPIKKQIEKGISIVKLLKEKNNVKKLILVMTKFKLHDGKWEFYGKLLSDILAQSPINFMDIMLDNPEDFNLWLENLPYYTFTMNVITNNLDFQLEIAKYERLKAIMLNNVAEQLTNPKYSDIANKIYTRLSTLNMEYVW